jgi:phage terminase large subunit
MDCRFSRTTPFPSINLPLSAEPASNPTPQAVVQIADVMSFLFQAARYKVAYGGRGGVKSWSFARALLILGARNKLRVLCAREFQNSIKDSVHQLLQDQIALMSLWDYYQILQSEIRGITGTEFIFMGLKNNVNRIKSTEGIDICWVEEAEKISENSWQVLIPTIRKENSEIWVSFNPIDETDPTYKRFITNPPPDFTPDGKRYCYVVNTGWKDNPWLPEELKIEKDYLARVDKDAYDHVWGGQVQKKSNSQVMHDKCILDAFEPDLAMCECGHPLGKHLTGAGGVIPCKGCGCTTFKRAWKGPYYGADWGFSTDPVTLMKLWIHGKNLYIEEEFWRVGVELDALPAAFDTISGARDHVIRADNSRPETISYLQKHKENPYPKLTAAAKWSGSVEDGIAFLRSFEQIVIHPRCVHTDEESRTYKHKIDSLTGDVLPEIIDKNNHCWDAIRYAMEPLIKRRKKPGLFFVGAQKMGGEEAQGRGQVMAKDSLPRIRHRRNDLVGAFGLVDRGGRRWFMGK